MDYSYHNPLKKKFSREFFKNIPGNPGVYFMLNSEGSILYIGKAKNLKRRISTYSYLKPGKIPEHLIEMIENVQSIQWSECKSEKEAFMRENELLHALRPSFNIAHTEAENYLFIGYRENKLKVRHSLSGRLIKVDFELTSIHKNEAHGYRYHGCYKHRRKIKMGYTALLRLLYAANFEKERFHYPIRINRDYPPWHYSLYYPETWTNFLDRFLNGISNELLHLIILKLLESDFIPEFMRTSIQEDIEVVKFFFEIGPLHTYKLREKHKILRSTISHSEMDQLVASELKSLNLPHTV